MAGKDIWPLAVGLDRRRETVLCTGSQGCLKRESPGRRAWRVPGDS
jgi:hypothetical protein